MIQLRAFEIILFIIILQAAVVFTTDIGLFDTNYLEQSSLARNQYSTVNITENLSEFSNLSVNPSNWDYFKTSIVWSVEALVWFIKIIFSIIFIFPVLIKVFGVPTDLAAFLQVGIVGIYIWGLVQWKTKTSTKGMT